MKNLSNPPKAVSEQFQGGFKAASGQFQGIENSPNKESWGNLSENLSKTHPEQFQSILRVVPG